MGNCECGTPVRDTARFCAGCGKPVHRTCSCGNQVSSSARFCDRCGNSLVAEVASAAVPAPLPAASATPRWLHSMRDMPTIKTWLVQHRSALQAGQVTALEVLNQGFLTAAPEASLEELEQAMAAGTAKLSVRNPSLPQAPAGGYEPGHLTQQELEDGLAGRLHLAKDVGLTEPVAYELLEQPYHWSEDGDVRATKTVFRAMAALADDSYFWNIIGSCDSQLADPAGALVAFERALALDAGNLHAQLNRAETLFDLRRYGEAEAELTRIAQLNGNDREREVARSASSYLRDKQAAVKTITELLGRLKVAKAT